MTDIVSLEALTARFAPGQSIAIAVDKFRRRDGRDRSDAATVALGIGGTIGQISEIAKTIAVAVEQQGQATQEIARSVSKAAAGTSDVASNIDAVAHTIDATGRAAKDTLGAAGQLSKHAAALRDKVAGFLNAVQAA